MAEKGAPASQTIYAKLFRDEQHDNSAPGCAVTAGTGFLFLRQCPSFDTYTINPEHEQHADRSDADRSERPVDSTPAL